MSIITSSTGRDSSTSPRAYGKSVTRRRTAPSDGRGTGGALQFLPAVWIFEARRSTFSRFTAIAIPAPGASSASTRRSSQGQAVVRTQAGTPKYFTLRYAQFTLDSENYKGVWLRRAAPCWDRVVYTSVQRMLGGTDNRDDAFCRQPMSQRQPGFDAEHDTS